MRSTTGLIGLAALCCGAGCAAPPATPPADPEADFGGWTWDALKPADPEAGDVAVQAAWGSWQKKFVYVLLADETAATTTRIDASGDRTRYEVGLTWPDGRTAEVRVETADGRTGTAAYAGRSYDLADGAVFVLRPAGRQFELRQLKRDISDQAAGVSGAVRLVRNDPELVRMFARGK